MISGDGVAFVVGFFEESFEHKFFEEVAKSGFFPEFTFAITNPELIAELGQTVNTVAIFYHYQEPSIYSGPFETNDLVEFLTLNGYPRIERLVISQLWVNRITREARPMVIAFIEEIEQLDTFKTLSELEEFSKIYFAETLIAQYPDLPSQWGTSSKVFPTFVYVDWEDAQPTFKAFNEDVALTIESAKQFIQQCIEGTCIPHKKSEPIPEQNDAPIKIVVSKTFDSLVMDETKDVVLEFYAPWCAHCKALEPIYENVAVKLSKIENLVISKIDATANYINPSLGIKGFPTVMLFKAGEKSNPIQYDGARNARALISWIQNNSSMFKSEDTFDDLELENIDEQILRNTEQSKDEDNKDEL